MSRTLLKTPAVMLERIAQYAKENGEFIDTEMSDIDTYCVDIEGHKVSAIYMMDKLDRVDIDSQTEFSLDGENAYCEQGNPDLLLTIYSAIC